MIDIDKPIEDLNERCIAVVSELRARGIWASLVGANWNLLRDVALLRPNGEYAVTYVSKLSQYKFDVRTIRAIADDIQRVEIERAQIDWQSQLQRLRSE